MRRTALIILIGALILIAAVAVTAAKIVHKTETVSAEGAKRLMVSCSFGAGKLTVSPEDLADAARLEVAYEPEKVDYRVEYEVKDGTGYLEMKSHLNHHLNIDDTDNEWNAAFSTRYPMELKMEVGACEANIDLGGLKLDDLNLEIGAASGEIDFSRENQGRCRFMRCEAGASSLKIKNLGNAGFEDFKFTGGVGSFDIDFRGKYQGESTAKMEIGLGSGDITLPKGLPIRIEADENWFSSIDLHGEDVNEVHKGVYESDDFDSAKDRLVLKIEVGLGSVDLYWR
jgi:hypothetical protein